MPTGDAGAPPGSIEDIDVRPWAAYVLGHHPYLLGIWQVTAFGDREPRARADVQAEWDRFRCQLGELGDAVSALDRLRLVTEGKLDQFSEYKEDLHHSFLKALTGFGDYARILDPRTVVTGERAWEMLAALSRLILSPSMDLYLWREFGEAVGAARLSFAAGDIEIADFRLGQIRKCIEDLVINDRLLFLRELAAEAGLLVDADDDRPNPEGGGAPVGRATPSVLMAFDEALRAWLVRLPSTEPLLHLQTDRLIFFGQQYSFGGRSKSEIACLWLLAERAPEAVERDEMKTQGRMKIKTLKFMDERISRMRGILRDVLEVLRDRVGRELSTYEEYGDCYIRAVDIHRSSDLLCAYRLELDPARVRVTGPRPPWMEPAADE